MKIQCNFCGERKKEGKERKKEEREGRIKCRNPFTEAKLLNSMKWI